MAAIVPAHANLAISFVTPVADPFDGALPADGKRTRTAESSDNPHPGTDGHPPMSRRRCQGGVAHECWPANCGRRFRPGRPGGCRDSR